MKISNTFNFNSVRFNQENEVILMTSLKAPKVRSEQERAPLSLSLVLDVSGSMSGQKLDGLKKSVVKLIEQMTDKDRIGVVAFASNVDEVYSPQLMTPVNKSQVIYQVNQLRATTCTNMSGGIFKGFEQLKKQDLPVGTISRVLLFTDGYANNGLTKPEQFAEMIQGQTKNSNITVSCFGYGDHDAQSLQNIAENGKGNFYFIENIDEIAKVFARELGGLLTCYAQNISCFVELKKGSGELAEVLNDLSCDSTDDDLERVKITLDDIYSEEEKHLLVKMNLSKVTKAVTQRPSSLVSILVTYNDMTQNGKFVEKRVKAKIKFVKPELAQVSPTLAVQEQMTIIDLSKAHEKAKEYADSGHFDRARQTYFDVSVQVQGLADSGSFYGSVLADDILSKNTTLTAATYTSNAANSLSSTSRGLKNMRAVDGVTQTLYANSTQKNLEDSFSKTIDPADGANSASAAELSSGDTITLSGTGNNVSSTHFSFPNGTLGEDLGDYTLGEVKPKKRLNKKRSTL